MTKLTIDEIARRAKVSQTTVSRVLNDSPRVRASTRSRVLQVIDEAGYVPSLTARGLARRRTQVIGLLIPSEASRLFSHAYFATIIPCLAASASSQGYLLTLSAIGEPETESRLFRQVLRTRLLDGVILLSPHMDEPVVPLLVRDRIPFVMFGRHAYLKNITWVDVDNYGGAYAAVMHLIKLGRQRIATFVVRRNEAWAIDRCNGYKNALVESGFTIQPELIVDCDNSEPGGYEAMKQLLRLPHPPDALFAPGEESALGAIRAARESDLSVPEDVAIVGYDDFRTRNSAHIPLTTVRQPTERIAHLAVDTLIERIEHPDAPPVQKVLPVELVVRETCGAHLAVAAGPGR